MRQGLEAPSSQCTATGRGLPGGTPPFLCLGDELCCHDLGASCGATVPVGCEGTGLEVAAKSLNVF